jgi:hypothetical protein
MAMKVDLYPKRRTQIEGVSGHFTTGYRAEYSEG